MQSFYRYNQDYEQAPYCTNLLRDQLCEMLKNTGELFLSLSINTQNSKKKFTSNDAVFQTWNMLALQSTRMQYCEASLQWHHIRKSSFPKLWRRGRLCGILTTNLWKFSHQVNIWFYLVMMVVICKQMAFLSG